jgi:PTH1 family peptidyl-tRNA hydrolase
MASWIIAGLGNPGTQYEQTRHNVGFWLLDQLARDNGVSFSVNNRYHGELAQFNLDGHKVYLLKPLTFMNRSGQFVAVFANFFKIPLDKGLVIHDELYLAPGVVRIKSQGGHGGHNGLRDIIAQAGGKQFLRCRLGIGHPGNSKQVADYVLSKPSQVDRQLIEDAIDNMLRIMPEVLSGQLDKAMNWLHSQ